MSNNMESCHTKLLSAIQDRQTDLAISLLQEECEQHTLDSGLCWASRYGNIDLVTLLVRYGANPNAKVWGGFSPLLWATIFSPNAEVIKILLEAGSNIEHTSSKRRQTALHAAIIRGNTMCASILLEAGAHCDVQDYLYKTPLLHAVHRHSVSGVKLLIKHNCNVNLGGWVTGTSTAPLALALVQNDPEITKLLLLAGARFEQPALYMYHTYNIAQFYDMVENQLQFEVRPTFLQQHCRICIRHLIKPNFLQKLKEMQLPQKLKDFLEIDEITV